MTLGTRAVLHTARKWKKDAAAFLPASFHHNFGVVRAGDCRRTGGTGRGTARHHRGQLYRRTRICLPEVGQMAAAVLIVHKNLFQRI